MVAGPRHLPHLLAAAELLAAARAPGGGRGRVVGGAVELPGVGVAVAGAGEGGVARDTRDAALVTRHLPAHHQHGLVGDALLALSALHGSEYYPPDYYLRYSGSCIISDELR